MKVLKFLLLALISTFSIVVGVSHFDNLPGLASTPHAIAQQAADLTQQGYQYFAVGNIDGAFHAWQDAEDRYREIGNLEGITGSRINQSLALQAMGQSRRACKTLLTTLNLETTGNSPEHSPLCEPQVRETVDFSQLDSSSLNTIALRNLGNVWRSIGNLELSKLSLEKSLEIARSLERISDIDTALLGLGNTEEAAYERWRDLFDRTGNSTDRNRAIEQAKSALDLYRQVGETEFDRADLNRLNLLLKAVAWLREKEIDNPANLVAVERSAFQSEILPLAEKIVAHNDRFSRFTPIERIYANLTLARSLSQVRTDPQLKETAFLAAKEAYQNARQLPENFRIQSEALGTIGYLYEGTEEYAKAREYTQLALNLARSIRAEDLISQWSWQLGRIDESRGDIDGSIAAYQMAVNSIDSVRKDLLAVNSDWQFSFRENIKPVYEEYLNLLLRSSQPTQNELKRAIEVSDRFQTAELENFLRCNLSPSQSLDNSSLRFLKSSTNRVSNSSIAIIRVIVLEPFERAIEIVQNPLSHPDLFTYRQFSGEDWRELQRNITSLKTKVRLDDFRDLDAESIAPQTQAIYRFLISPIQDELPENGTLVFLLDSTLQSIPMSMLQDESGRYLIERYQVAVSFPTLTVNSTARSNRLSEVFAAGLSVRGESFDLVSVPFKPLEKVTAELNTIREVSPSSLILDDEKFTTQKFEKWVQQSNFPIVHIATHGQFSSVPNETFILAYDRPIDINQLDTILRDRTEGTRKKLELLVLSACQTAKDDKRGGLGLAGVAIRAGAENTVASLWNISDGSTSEFMKEFYNALQQQNVSELQALRQAQLKFLTDSKYIELKYDRPYHWAAFISIVNSL